MNIVGQIEALSRDVSELCVLANQIQDLIEANFLDNKKSNSIEPKKNQWKPNSPTKKTSTRGPGKNIKIDLTYP